jgi:hypothetical protein
MLLVAFFKGEEGAMRVVVVVVKFRTFNLRFKFIYDLQAKLPDLPIR